MEASCPITTYCVDEHAARLTALFVVILGSLFLISSAPVVAGLVAVDFFLRAFLRPAMSPLARLSRAALAALKVAPHPVNAGPKVFAARIGFIMCACGVACALAGMPLAAASLFGVLCVCALIEACWGFCVGCALYAVVHRGARGGDHAV